MNKDTEHYNLEQAIQKAKEFGAGQDYAFGESVIFDNWTQVQQLINSSINSVLGEVKGYRSPKIITFEGVLRTNCPISEQEKIEGTVGWRLNEFGDSGPVTDKYGVEYVPIPLYSLNKIS